MLVPFFLGAALGGIASGRVPVGNAAGDLIDSWLNPTSIAIGALGVLTGAYLAAVYLAADSVRAEQPELAEAFRARALGAGILTGAVAIGSLLVVRSDARPLFDGLTSGGGLVAVLASALAGAATLALVLDPPLRRRALHRGRRGRRRSRSAGRSRRTRTCCRASSRWRTARRATPSSTALVVAVGIGFLILVPSLVYLYRLVLRGTLDQAYEPLDQRFRVDR